MVNERKPRRNFYIPLHDGIYDRLKRASIKNSLNKGEMNDHIVKWYLTCKIDEFPFFIAPPRTGKQESIWVDGGLNQRIKERAEQSNTSSNRMIYTAIILYLYEQQLLTGEKLNSPLRQQSQPLNCSLSLG